MSAATTRICVLTPDHRSEDFKLLWANTLANMAKPLAVEGLTLETRSWTEAGDLRAFDLVLPLLVWGYHRAPERWAEQVASWERARVPMMNPPGVLRWNADKSYLARLSERGAPVVPTRFVERVTHDMLEDIAAELSVDRLVAKPRVSATAWRTIRWSPGGSLDDGPEGAAIVQPYLSSIEEEGEVSLIYADGRFSHAIRKRPRPGDFRVQPKFEGVTTRHDAAPDERAAAERVLGAVEEALLYARVDLVRDHAGAPVLMELELVEPDLYLEHDSGEGTVFVEAIKTALHVTGRQPQ